MSAPLRTHACFIPYFAPKLKHRYQIPVDVLSYDMWAIALSRLPNETMATEGRAARRYVKIVSIVLLLSKVLLEISISWIEAPPENAYLYK